VLIKGITSSRGQIVIQVIRLQDLRRAPGRAASGEAPEPLRTTCSQPECIRNVNPPFSFSQNLTKPNADESSRVSSGFEVSSGLGYGLVASSSREVGGGGTYN